MHTLEIAIFVLGSTFMAFCGLAVICTAIYKTFRAQIDAVIDHILNEQQ